MATTVKINKKIFLSRVKRQVSSRLYDHLMVHVKAPGGTGYPLIDHLVENGEPVDNGDDEIDAIVMEVMRGVEAAFFKSKDSD